MSLCVNKLFYYGKLLTDPTTSNRELEDLFAPDVRQKIITWINMDKLVSAQLQKLENSPWALGKDGICEQFGEAMSTGCRELRLVGEDNFECLTPIHTCQLRR